MAAKKKAPTAEGSGKIVCTVDRLVLEDGTVLARGQEGICPADHAESYETQGRAKRV